MPVRAEPLLRHIHRLVSHPDADPGSDAELLGRFVGQRDEQAFAVLVSRHAPLVLGVCRRVLRDAHQAEDALQAVFLVLARKAAAVRPPDRLAAWLYGVARQVALNALRGEARRRQREGRAGRAACPQAARDPLDEMTARELLAALDEEVQRLPETFRLPVILCCLEGKTQEEAARQLGWTLGSVKGRLERGRARLHARLVKRGLSLAVALAALEIARGSGRAGVPATLAVATARAGLAFGTAGGCAGGIAPQVVALAEEAVQGMAVAKTKLGVVLLLAAGLLAAGAGLVAQQVLAAKQPEGQSTPAREPERAQDDKGSEPRRTDRYGDPLPAGAVARLGTVRLRTGYMTYALAFTPDGKTLASAGNGRGLCLWDAATGRELRQIVGVRDAIPLAISPDGKLLASAYELEKVHLWELKTGRERAELPGSPDGVPLAVAFSPDGALLASAGHDKLIRLADVAGGREVRQLRGHEESVMAVAFAPDGKTLASGGLDRTVRLWDPATGRERARLTGHKNYVVGVAFFPDGKTLASVSEDEAVRLWDVAGGTELRALEAPAGAVALAISPDGRLLASGHTDGLIRLWDPATGKELRHWKANAFYRVSALAFSPDGKTLASGGHVDSSVRLWDPATGQERLPFGGPRHGIVWLRFAADGRSVLLGSRDSTVRRWDWVADRERILATAGVPYLNLSRFSPDGRVRASADNQEHTVTVWDDPASTKGRVLGKHRGGVAALALSADGKLLASGGDGGEVHLWDIPTGKELRAIDAGQVIGSLAFSPDGKTLATGAGTFAGGQLRTPTIRLWDVATGKAVGALPHGEHVFQLVFSPDGKLLASSGWWAHDYGPRLWDLSAGKELPLPAANSECNGLAFSPDSRLLAWGDYQGDDHVRVLEVATQQEVLSFRAPHGGIYPIAFAPDGRLLASAGADSTALVWDLTGHYRDGRLAPVKLSPGELEDLWNALGDANAARAFQARQTLALGPADQVVSLLRERLRPEPEADPKQVAAWIADLDSGEFAVREKAMHGLEGAGFQAGAALRTALAAKPGPEARRRIQALLEGLEPSAKEPLRKRRAVAVLEQLGTPAARAVLEQVAKSLPEPYLNREAKAALDRLAARAADAREPGFPGE
jgi:RNA polymerase sigma factor (sigma-70 family)